MTQKPEHFCYFAGRNGAKPDTRAEIEPIDGFGPNGRNFIPRIGFDF